MRKISLALLCAFTVVSLSARPKAPTVIVQLSDPQMGFYADNRDMEYEIRTYTATVEAINRLKPDAVVITGDCVHNAKDEAQWSEFKRITARIDPKIEVRCLPGNHDIRRTEGSVDITPYTTHLGADHFTIRVNGVLLTGFDSNYLKYETADPSKEADQFRWLTRSLRKGRKTTSLVFLHHPFFLRQIDEADGYSVIQPEKRSTYFDLFRKTGVAAVFSGHLHDNAEAVCDHTLAITTSAVGRQLGGAQSGIRIIVVQDGAVNHRYFPIEEIPADRTALIGLFR